MVKSKQSIRNKADRLLQEYIRREHGTELCELCGERQVSCGHHFIYKSQSLALRYELENIIPLCRDCHLYAHRWQNLFSANITAKRGEDWLCSIERLRREGLGVKFTKEWAELKLKVLEQLLQTLKCQ